MKCSHVPYKHRYGKALKQYDVTSFDHVELAKYKASNPRAKVLFVLDFMPADALECRKMFGSYTGALFDSIFKIAEDHYNSAHTLNEYSWLAISYHSFKTMGGSSAFRELASSEFKKRLNYMIGEYKPDIVVTFGRDPYAALNEDYVSRFVHDGSVQWQQLYGNSIPTEIDGHKFKHVPTLSLQRLLKDESGASLLGYVARNMLTVLNDGVMPYSIGKPEYKIVMVDTLAKFKKLYKRLMAAKLVAIDSESRNLNKKKNYTVTWQFAFDERKAYILPYLHKDTPFLPEELRVIKKMMRKYFETNTNVWQLYANGGFDMCMARRDFEVRYFRANVWDVQGAEHALDENHKWLATVDGYRYYNLLSISMQYGTTAYYDSDFGKEQRAFIADADLEGPVLDYMALDVVLLHHIRNLQMRKAADSGYESFSRQMLQNSDLVHTLSTLEYNGVPLDINWLFRQKMKDSIIHQERQKVLSKLNNTKGVKAVNQLLLKQSGAPSVGLFGRTHAEVFKPTKHDHKEALFFDILKLKPLALNEKGVGKIDKEFQKAYEDVEEVKLFGELGKIEKIYTSYIKSFIKKWGTSEDMRADRRIRPRFQYLPVVTGRTSATDPTLQTLPQRGALSNVVKRCFVAEDGRIIIKVDFSAHENRCWSLISGDKEVAAVFQHGKTMREEFKLKPTQELAERVSLEGDAHKLNAAYFFKVDIKEVTKTLRGSVKQVIFGLIYQQSEKGTAKSIGATVDEVKKLVAAFFKRFPDGVGWFDKVKAFARKNMFVESPVGRRRHLWALRFPKKHPDGDSIVARTERQSVNSPVQGLGSDFMMTGARQIEVLKYEHFEETGHYPDFESSNSVHDSLEFSCGYEDFWLAINIIENGLTERVRQVNIARSDFDFLVGLEIDFDIGYSLSDVCGWNLSLTGDIEADDKKSLDTILAETHKGLTQELGHKISKKEFFKKIHSGFKHAPAWAKKQRKYWEAKGIKAI